MLNFWDKKQHVELEFLFFCISKYTVVTTQTYHSLRWKMSISMNGNT